ncbi:MAG: diacylglycerol kinase family lipid kinase [Chloroflexi bacterium]|nr:MAG: diacylglycerol kinase family lipid kinase [Chloroflexota bacterium]
MQATLIFNKSSGSTDSIEPQEIIEALRRKGFETIYPQTEDENDLDLALEDPKDLVVAAGGDGTFREIAIRLLGRNIPIVPLPLGTANNIARSLNLSSDWEQIIEGLDEPYRRPFDMGCVRLDSSSYYFLEAFGFGYYATGLAAYNPEEGKSVLRSLAAFAETVNNFFTEPVSLVLDDQDISGKYIIAEVMNTDSFGPRIKFSPDSNPSDGIFEVIRIDEENRKSLLSYFTSLINGELTEQPSVLLDRGRKLEMIWTGNYPLHADAVVIDPIREPDDPGLFPVTVEIIPSALELWLPVEAKNGKE